MDAEPEVPKEVMDALFDKTSKKASPAAKSALPAAEVPPKGSQDSTGQKNGLSEAPVDLEPEDIPDEDAPEPEIEAREPVEIDDDMELEITVDEQPVKVTLKELKANYSGEKAIAKRIEQASIARNAAQQNAVWLYEANQAAMGKLQQLDQNLQQFAEPPVNWDWLYHNNRAEFVARKEQQLFAKERQAQLQAEQAQIQQNQAYLNEQAKEAYLEEQAELLRTKLPELSDPGKAKSLMGSIQTAIGKYGYTVEELKAVSDHRIFHALRDLAKYQELLARKANRPTGAPQPSTMLRAGSSTSNTPAASAKSKVQAITNRARQTGHQDDVAAFLIATSPKANRR